MALVVAVGRAVSAAAGRLASVRPARLRAQPRPPRANGTVAEGSREVAVAANDAQADRVEGARRPSSAHGKRQLRIGVGVGLAIIVLVAGVTAALVVTVPSSSSGHNQHLRQVASSPTSPAPPPLTTVPPPAPPSTISPRSSDNQGAVYTTGSSHQVVSTVASGNVWLEFVAGTQPSGSVLWEGFLKNDQSQTITSDGSIWLRIGDVPNVAVSVNGSRVSIPPDKGVYNLTFSAS